MTKSILTSIYQQYTYLGIEKKNKYISEYFSLFDHELNSYLNQNHYDTVYIFILYRLF